MKSVLLATTLLFAPAAALAAAPATAPAFDAARLNAHIKTLSSDAFEGRGPATAGETKTVDYLIAQMKAAGLEPGGQIEKGKRSLDAGRAAAALEHQRNPNAVAQCRRHAQGAGAGRADRGARGPDRDKSVKIKDAPLVFVGYGVAAPERKWDDFKGVDLKGKIMVVLVNDPDFETGEGDFGGKAMTYYGRWTYKYEEAARQGAAGVLVIHETDPAAYGWATVKNSNTNTMFDIVRKDPKKSHTAMEGWIQRDEAVASVQGVGARFRGAEETGADARLQTGAVEGESVGRLCGRIRSDRLKNVAGRLTGKTRPDETIVYSAHWDHLGVGQPDKDGDTIYNGAVDNATGTAALIEMGRAFAKAPRTDRSLVFLAVTAEEKGLLGSEYYASNPLYPLGKTVALLNTDALGVYGPARNFSTSGTAKLELLDGLIAEGKAHGRAFSPDPHPEYGSFYRSDHFPFAKRGVPALSIELGQRHDHGRDRARAKL